MNNRYHQHHCPALMSDSGRLFTNYMSSTRTNIYSKYLNGITNEHDYRLFLQKNGQQIINNEREFLEKRKKCNFSHIKCPCLK